MSLQHHDRRPMTLTEKILYAHAVAPERPYVAPGDEIRIRVDWTIASELAWNGMNQTYERLGRPALHDPARFYLAIDHTVDPGTLANDPRAQRLAQLSRDFAAESGIRHFYDANVTILHTKFYRDLVLPGDVVLGADSHTSSHGGLAAFSIGLGGADITMAMVRGESWIQVPEAIRVDLRGALPFGLTGKDTILRTLGALGRNTVAMERTVEFTGDQLNAFSADFRFTVANMTAEFGGLNGIFPADAVTRAYVQSRRTRSTRADATTRRTRMRATWPSIQSSCRDWPPRWRSHSRRTTFRTSPRSRGRLWMAVSSVRARRPRRSSSLRPWSWRPHTHKATGR